MAKSKESTVCASSGGRHPAYANWYYISMVYTLEDGTKQRTGANHAGIDSPMGDWSSNARKCIERTVDSHKALGASKVGQPIGFGPTPAKIVSSFGVLEPTFEPHPEEIVVRVKEDAAELLQNQLRLQHCDWGHYTNDEQQSMQTLRMLLGEELAVVRDEDIPQMSGEQFWNTMPHHKAPAGFYLPKGLCEVVRQSAVASEEQIKRARDMYQTDDVEIDHNAKLSVGDDGVWVSAWVWLPNEEDNEDEENNQ